MTTVNIIEYERGWGQRIDEVRHFSDLDEATKFVREFNAKNTEPEAPDWYMQAEVVEKSAPRRQSEDSEQLAPIDF